MCSYRTVPDVDFFLNKRDHPQLKSDYTEPYDFLFDSFEKTPLLPPIYQTNHSPIFSFFSSDQFADILIPSADDWECASGLVFFTI